MRNNFETQNLNGIAVDFGGTKIAATRVTDGKVGAVSRSKTDGSASAEQQVDAICDLLKTFDLQDDDKVGVALTGRVSREGVWHAVNTDTLSGVSSVPMQSMLSERLKRSVKVDNDATAAAIGEYISGAGQGVHSFGFITVSTGVGGGFVLDGRPLRSSNGIAGHVGFTTSRIATELCGSGRAKTVESVAGGRSIAALALKSGRSGYDAKAVFSEHLNGVKWASHLIEQSADVVSELCSNLVTTLGLERIALGGSIGLAEGYLELVQAAMDQEPVLFRPEIVPTQLGADSAFVGILTDI